MNKRSHIEELESEILRLRSDPVRQERDSLREEVRLLRLAIAEDGCDVSVGGLALSVGFSVSAPAPEQPAQQSDNCPSAPIDIMEALRKALELRGKQPAPNYNTSFGHGCDECGNTHGDTHSNTCSHRNDRS